MYLAITAYHYLKSGQKVKPAYKESLLTVEVHCEHFDSIPCLNTGINTFLCGS